MAYSFRDAPARKQRGLRPKPLRDVATFRFCRLKYRNEVTEEDLLKRKYVTPDDVKKLRRYTKNYLCSLEDNIYEVDFEKLQVIDMDTRKTFFEIRKRTKFPDFDSDGNEIIDEDDNYQHEEYDEEEEYYEDPETKRFIRYEMTPDFLFTRAYGSKLQFTTGGEEPLLNFRMIERVFFQNSLLESFDFKFGTVDAFSRSAVYYTYSFPSLTDEKRYEMMMHPFETRSDTFYFANDHLIMHVKAEYSFNGEDYNLLI